MKTRAPDQKPYPLPPSDGTSFRLRAISSGVVLLCIGLLSCSLVIMVNQASHNVIMGNSEAQQMIMYYQFAHGQHGYYNPGIGTSSDGYTPLGYELNGLVIRLFGNDVRWVRIANSMPGMGAFLLVGLIVWTLTRRRVFGFIALCLAAWVDAGWFVGLGPNQAHVFFGLLGLYLLIRCPEFDWKTAIGALLAFTACCWSKQTGLIYVVGFLVYALIRDHRKGLACLAVAVVINAALLAYYKHLPNSDFLYWVLEMNAHQPLIWSRIWEMLLPMYLTQFGILIIFLMAGLLLARSPQEFFKDRRWIVLGVFFVLGGVASAATLKYGSGSTQAYLFMCFLIVAGVVMADRLIAERFISPSLVLLLLALEGALLFKDIRPLLINAEDRARFQQILSILGTPGLKTFYNLNGYVNTLVGKPPVAWTIHGDCWRNKKFTPESFDPNVRTYLESDPFDLVIIDVPLEDNSFVLYDRLKKAYRQVTTIPASSRYSNTTSLRWTKLVFIRNSMAVSSNAAVPPP